MEKITTEILLTAMFEYGFEQIDPILYTYTLSNIVTKSAKKQEFDFSFSEPLSNRFNYHVYKAGQVYKLKDNTKDKAMWFKYNGANSKLLNYFIEEDFAMIIEKKRETLGLKIEEVMKNPLFSKKEKEILINYNNPTIERIREQEEMKTSTDYIEWLRKFTQEEMAFEDNELAYEDNTDIEMIKKLSTFFGIIVEYAESNNINEKLIDDGYCYYIKYKDTILELGLYQGQGVTNYSTIASDKYASRAINYEDIINYYKDKPKTYKKQ